MIVQASAPRNGDLWDAVRKLTLNAESRKDEIFLVQLHRYFLGEIDISFTEVEGPKEKS